MKKENREEELNKALISIIVIIMLILAANAVMCIRYGLADYFLYITSITRNTRFIV